MKPTPKLIVLGDTHGRPFWKDVVRRERFDRIILIGDYFDSPDIDPAAQMRNFRELMAWRADHPEKMVCLIGNHDFHYLPPARMAGEAYSGFQEYLSEEIGYLLQQNRHFLQMAHAEGGYLFTHAGVTRTWLNRLHQVAEEDPGPETDAAIRYAWRHHPSLFLFSGTDPSGDDPEQSPIWVRPPSMEADGLPLIQVVGHTRQPRLRTEPFPLRQGGAAFFVDTLGTSREYLILENGVASAGRV